MRANADIVEIMEGAVERQVGGKLGTRKVLAELAEYERDCVDDLLNGCPQEGGNVSRGMLEKLISTAFVSGVLHAANSIAKSDL